MSNLPKVIRTGIYTWDKTLTLSLLSSFIVPVRSSLRREGFSLVVAHGFSLSSCGAWAPGCVGSVVVVHGLSCPAACGILVPRPGIEPTSPALKGEFFTTGPWGKSL